MFILVYSLKITVPDQKTHFPLQIPVLQFSLCSDLYVIMNCSHAFVECRLHTD